MTAAAAARRPPRRRGGLRPEDVPDIDALVPFIDWPTFMAQLDYRYDEHVTAIGPTRRGKTTLLFALAQQRRNVVALATKREDKGIEKLAREYRYRRQRSGPVPPPSISRRTLIWPPAGGLSGVKRQENVIRAVLDQIEAEGNRAILADEVHYLSDFLHLAPMLKLIWQQGASNGLSLLAGFQRPAWVPRDAYSAATHLCVFGSSDHNDIKAIGGLGGLNVDVIRYVVAWLGDDPARRHDFLYVNTRTGNMVRSRFSKSAAARSEPRR